MKKKRLTECAQDRVFYLTVNIIVSIIFLIVLYPLIYIVSSSFSSASAVSAGKVFLWPVDFSLAGYAAVFKSKDIWTGFFNSGTYVVVGTIINVIVTLFAAYPLSRKTLPCRNLIMFIFTFTMFFSGGMIPSYILVRNIGMMNTMWAMIVPGALSVYNMIIVKTFLQSSIPHELLEASKIDGCSDIKYFRAMILPLSKPVIAVIALFYAVGHWNAYFNAFLYLTDDSLFPLQIFLREILIINEVDPAMLVDEEIIAAKQGLADLMKYSLVIVATVPMLILYPFIQKYFVKGVMIGSIKG